MVQCLLEVSLSPVRRGAGVSQGRGRRWPKKKPSGSDSEEEEQVGQGASSLGSRGVSRRPCACPWRASVWSPVRYSCSALDPRIPLRVSRLELTAVARRVAREMVAAFGWAQSGSPTLQSPSSPVPGGVRNAHLRAASLLLPDSGGAAARSQSQSGPNLPLRPEQCAPPPWVRSRLPPLPASAQQRAAAAPAQERVPRRSPNRGAGWVLEALGARRPGTRGQAGCSDTMGSCCSCLNRDSVSDNHPTKFKVTNVDDEGVELGSGVMELTQSELVLHLHRREAVRWPYLCLRRYGYDSNLFSFESGRRCQTGQGIFAFKCSRAEEIFNLLQDLMQCNSINVMEEPVIITRNSHPAELDLPRAPQPPNALGYTISSFSNGFPGCPGEGPRFSAPRRPSTSSLRHPSLGEESTHALIAPDEQSHTYVNTPASEEEQRRSRHCLQPLPEGRAPFVQQARGPDQRDPQVFLQPGQVKFVLGPTPARRHMTKCQGLCPSLQDAPHHNNNNEGLSECPAQPKCTYENVSGGLRPGAGWKLSPEEPGWNGLAQRRAALLHYENLPSLPPVWESQAPQPGEEAGDDGDSRDGLTPSSNGFPEGEEDETPLQKPTSTRPALRSHGSFPVPLTRRRGSPRVFNFDFRRPGAEPPRQLNYIQVELKGWGGDHSKGPPNPSAPRGPVPTTHPTRSSDSYAVIDLKKTVAMSNLQRALPRDDGTARKTRHNSTDLPL